jgi:hypothetical protein
MLRQRAAIQPVQVKRKCDKTRVLMGISAWIGAAVWPQFKSL